MPTPPDPPAFLQGTMRALRPPPRLSLSQWADRYFVLSAESAAEPGRWRTLPYQRGMMDAITDPNVEQVSVMKSARIGYTKVLNAAIGYFMHQDPCPIMVVQPTVEDAQGYSKEEIAPMLRDCDVLRDLIQEPKAKTSESTILHKSFPGGSLSMVGANSGRGFRRVSRRVVIFDEVDGYPPSAGSEGDQIKLGIRRAEYYWNRKIVAGSTPLVAGVSRIEQLFEDGDQRRYYVPCPSCDHMDFLVFRERQDGRGHHMQWPEDKPEEAFFVCSKNGCVIEERDKRPMLAAGEWRAEAEFTGHASFHIWAAYSLSPNATWAQIADEFLDAKRQGVEKLKTFVNTTLGETWQERGEAPDWERLYNRREPYPIGSAPEGVYFITAGADVQKDRIYYEVVGWGLDKQSWTIEAGALYGDTAGEEVWAELDELVGRSFPGAAGRELPIATLGIDSGYNTQQVYNWARRYPMTRVIACKGVGSQRTLIGQPSPVDININGKRSRRGYKVWPVGVGVAKSELYGWLRLPQPVDDEPAPPGYCHFPELEAEFFRQLTAEQLVTITKRSGHPPRLEWQIIPGRQNHWLDCRVYARAAAAVQGLDRVVSPPTGGSSPASQKAKPAAEASPAPARAGRKRKGGGWLKGGRGGGWLGKRR